jgi:ascorbate-specific PTS system EIIC-type component UlaA
MPQWIVVVQDARWCGRIREFIGVEEGEISGDGGAEKIEDEKLLEVLSILRETVMLDNASLLDVFLTMTLLRKVQGQKQSMLKEKLTQAKKKINIVLYNIQVAFLFMT